MNRQLDHLHDLTQRYARYSRSAGGLSLVFGGALLLVAFAVGALVPLTPALRIALAASPLLWLAVKEGLRAFYYQGLGGVAEQLPPRLVRQHRWMVIYLFVIAAIVVAGVFWFGGPEALRGPMAGYLALVIALPFAGMRWFWSIGDFLVGVLLFCQAAVVLAGGHYGGWWLAYVAVCAAIAIGFGLHEHREYLRIRAALRGVAEAA